MKEILIVLGIAVIVVLGVLALVIILVFAFDPPRGLALMNALALLVSSVAKNFGKKKKHRHSGHHHRRATDSEEAAHVHVRRNTPPRPSMMMTIRDPEMLTNYLKHLEERRHG